MQTVFELARTAARSPSTILDPRRERHRARSCSRARSTPRARAHGAPFVAVSCAALTETLLESELFGHEKGAFTGAATRRRGTFETAQRRHALPRRDRRHQPEAAGRPAARARRRGSSAASAATSRSRSTCASSPRPTATCRRRWPTGEFRDDLFYRLNVIPITLPPLRDRREDIPLLVEHFLDRMSAELGAADRRRLARRDGDADVVSASRATCASCATSSSARWCARRGRSCRSATSASRRPPRRPPRPPSLEDVERRHIAAILDHCGGNVSQAARHPRHRSRDALQQDQEVRAARARGEVAARRHDSTPAQTAGYVSRTSVAEVQPASDAPQRPARSAHAVPLNWQLRSPRFHRITSPHRSIH